MDSIYIFAVIIMIILTSAVLASILYKNKLFNFRMFMAIVTSSIIVCILFPIIFNIITGISGFLFEGMGIFLAFILTLVVYIFLVFLMSIIVMSFNIESHKNKSNPRSKTAEKLKKMFQRSANKENSVDSGRNIDKMGLDTLPTEKENASEGLVGTCGNDAAESSDTCPDTELQTLDEASEAAAITWPSSKDIVVSETPVNDITEDANTAANYVSDERTMTAAPELMGQEINMSLEDCINEAFRLKTAGDLEGAIIYYMYALDSIPGRDLVFLLILDICTLYKALGQVELAKEILEGYYSRYGDIMDYSVRSEIERNLQDM